MREGQHIQMSSISQAKTPRRRIGAHDPCAICPTTMTDAGTLVSLTSRTSSAAPLTRDAEHEARTVEAIRRSLATVPFYAKQKLAVPAEGAALAELLAALPLVWPSKVRATLPKAWLPEGRDAKAELGSGALSVVELGAGESRVRFLWDAAWWRAQETRALRLHPRAEATMGSVQGGYRDAVLWVPERGTGSCGAGDPTYDDRLEGARLHLNSRQDPAFWSDAVKDRMLDELVRHGAVGLWADPYYLEVLARHASRVGRRLDVSGFVALTRALPLAGARRAIGRAHDHVIDVFAAREAGVLFVEGTEKNMHHAPFTTHVELLPVARPTPGADDVALVVVTTLDRDVQPLVRYVLGDLVRTSRAPSAFTTVHPILGVEGKLEDVLVRPDGALITPAAIDRALAPLELEGYQATQRSERAVDLEVIGGSADDAAAALAPLLAGLTVTPRAATAIAALPNGKYRSVQRAWPHDVSSSFGSAR